MDKIGGFLRILEICLPVGLLSAQSSLVDVLRRGAGKCASSHTVARAQRRAAPYPVLPAATIPRCASSNALIPQRRSGHGLIPRGQLRGPCADRSGLLTISATERTDGNGRSNGTALPTLRPANAGLAAARARGQRAAGGQKLTLAKRATARQPYDAKDKTAAEIAEIVGVARSTLYHALDPAGSGRGKQ